MVTSLEVQQKEGIRAVVPRVSKRKPFVAKGLGARVPTTGHRRAIRRGILEKAPHISDTMVACRPVIVDIHTSRGWGASPKSREVGAWRWASWHAIGS